MGTTAHSGASLGRRIVIVLLAAAMGLFGVLLASGQAQAHDHRVPQTVLMKGTKELQAGTKVKETSWDRPAGDGLCENRKVIYRTRFPETDTVASGSKLRARVSKAQRPDSFLVGAYRAVDEEGAPTGEARILERTLERVVVDGKTVAWDAVFSVKSPDRNYYLVSEGHWQDREGCGADQYASWSFHVKTRV